MQHQKYFDDILSGFIFKCLPKQTKLEAEKSCNPEQKPRSQSGVFDPKLLNLYKAIDLAG